MEWIVAILVLVYWIGFYVGYFIVFKPYDDSLVGWIESAGFSLIWFITIPLKYFIKKLI